MVPTKNRISNSSKRAELKEFLYILKTEWLKPCLTTVLFLFIFLILNSEIMDLFNWLVVPILSTVNEGIIASIVFSFLFISISVYWYNRFRQWYYVKPLPILTCMLLCCIYWYYRFFTTNYTIIVSDLFHIGFSDIVVTALTSWSIISIFINLFRENYYKKKRDVLFKENSESPSPKFEEDKPITCSEDDELGFGEDVDLLFQNINGRQDSSSFSIGINARWGDGKSSFINLLAEKFIAYKDDYILIRFNPRYANNNSIQASFFETLFSELSKYDSRFKRSFNDYLKVIDVITDNNYMSALLNITELFNREDEKEKINEAIKHLSKRVIVIIEDLDRLMKDEIIEVLKLIDGNASFDNLIFISAYDKDSIHSLISSDECNTYSDKFFTYERTLPLRSPNLLLKFLLEHLIQNQGFSKDEEDEIRNIVRANSSLFQAYLHNLRDVKRYINLVKPSIKRIYKDIKVRDFLLIELVRYRYPNEYRKLYEQNYHKDSETNFERKITIDGIENEYTSQDILSILFPSDGNYSYRSINSIGAFSIYFHEHLFEHLSINKLDSLFDKNVDYIAIIKEIIDNKKWNELHEYLDSFNALSLSNWDNVIRYVDIYLHINVHYNETFNSTISVGILLEKKVADKLCEKFDVTIDEYKSIFFQRLAGTYPEYPYEISKQQLWAYKSGELRTELIFTEFELMDILKKSLRDLITHKPGYTALHKNIFRACISSIDPNSRKITLDAEVCKIILNTIENKPEEFINDFVFLGAISSSPDWNNITCEPFWKQIFASEELIKEFIFDEKLDNITNIKRVRNFWQIYEMNNYKSIEFENQGPVQSKIDANLEHEYEQLKELLSIEADVNSVIISQETLGSAYKILKESLKKLDNNTLYIKKRGDIKKLIIDKKNELKRIKESDSLEISQELYDKLQSFDDYIKQASQQNRQK